MTRQTFTMNMDKEIRKKLSHIAIDEETTVTEIITTLILNYIQEYDNMNKNE